MLSGFVFPIANMPAVVQWLSYLNPLRYFLVIIRGIFLKGTGFEVLWPQFAALLILGLLVFTGARWLGAVTPLGGLAFILGWVALAVAAIGGRSG